MLISLVSAKHAPGVTTGALALAVASAELGDTLFAEFDPAGGDALAYYHSFGLRNDLGLVSLAAAARRDEPAADVIWANTQPLPIGIQGLLAPTVPETASGALVGMGMRLGTALAQLPAVVWCDAGRWDPRQPSSDRLRASDLVLVFCQPTVAGVEHVNQILPSMFQFSRTIRVVLVGTKPYGVADVQAAIGMADVKVLGALDVDARTAFVLQTGADPKALRRLPLVRSAATLVESIRADVARRVVT